MPGLLQVARKLELDCAPAMVGWKFCGRGSHPVLVGASSFHSLFFLIGKGKDTCRSSDWMDGSCARNTRKHFWRLGIIAKPYKTSDTEKSEELGIIRAVQQSIKS